MDISVTNGELAQTSAWKAPWQFEMIITKQTGLTEISQKVSHPESNHNNNLGVDWRGLSLARHEIPNIWNSWFVILYACK